MSEPGGLHRYRSLKVLELLIFLKKTMSLSHIAHLFVEISLFPKQYFSWQVLDKSIFILERLFWATTQSYKNWTCEIMDCSVNGGSSMFLIDKVYFFVEKTCVGTYKNILTLVCCFIVAIPSTFSLVLCSSSSVSLMHF